MLVTLVCVHLCVCVGGLYNFCPLWSLLCVGHLRRFAHTPLPGVLRSEAARVKCVCSDGSVNGRLATDGCVCETRDVCVCASSGPYLSSARVAASRPGPPWRGEVFKTGAIVAGALPFLNSPWGPTAQHQHLQ